MRPSPPLVLTTWSELPSHLAIPLEEPLLNEPSDVPRSSAGAGSCGRSSWLQRYIDRMSLTFADVPTRVALSLVVCLALLGFIFWLIYVIQDKWLAATRFPATTLSVSAESVLPPIHAFLLQWGAPTGVGAVHTAAGFQRLVPFADVSAMYYHWSAHNRRSVPSQLQCLQRMLVAPWSVCVVPADAALTDAESFRDASTYLIFWVTLLYNRSEAALLNPLPADRPLLTPILGGFTDMIDVDTARELLTLAPLDDHTPDDDPRLARYQSIMDHTPGTYSLQANGSHTLNLGFAQTMRLNGAVEWRQTVQSIDRVAMLPSQIQAQLQSVRDRYSNDSQTSARLSSLLSDPALSLAVFQIGLGANSFSVEVTREYCSYSWTSFLSDLGGLLSISLMLLYQLFPPIEPTLIRREFLGNRLRKLRCCDRRSKQ